MTSSERLKLENEKELSIDDSQLYPSVITIY